MSNWAIWADPAVRAVIGGFSFALGAVIASFLNVVIWRVPRGESIVSPPSHCPKCNHAIRWYQNLPILSWLCLRGRCASCHAPISPRYILIETLGGVLFLAAFLRFGVSPATPVLWIWISLMIVGSFIDFDHQLLPDFVTVGGMILGVAAALADTVFAAYAGEWRFAWDWRTLLGSSLGWSLAGLSLGFTLLYLVRFCGSKAFGREAMGMGDVLLLGAVGALFGPVAVVFTLVFSSVFGSLAGVGMMLLAKVRFGRFVAIPYGPFIALACLLWMFAGPEIVSWYLVMMHG